MSLIARASVARESAREKERFDVYGEESGADFDHRKEHNLCKHLIHQDVHHLKINARCLLDYFYDRKTILVRFNG